MAKVLGVLVLVMALVAWGSAAQADHGRWQQVENNPSCVVWNANPQSDETVRWNGACENGKAHGRSTQVWRFLEDEEWKEHKYTGEMKDGKRHGRGVYVASSACPMDEVSRTDISTRIPSDESFWPPRTTTLAKSRPSSARI